MKRAVSLILAILLIFYTTPCTLAANDAAITAANKLNELGLFSGVGTNSDGSSNYDLDRAPTRQEAITMLVKLVGGAEEAGKGGWQMPFTDVDDWAKNWVGYAYTKGLTAGISATKFGAGNKTTVEQYLTFVLKALGYNANSDFTWNSAWDLSDKIRLTDGRYNANTAFTRGDMAIISYNALTTKLKGQDRTLADVLNIKIQPSTPAASTSCYAGTDVRTVTDVTGAQCTRSTNLWDSNGDLMFPQSTDGYVPGYDQYTYFFESIMPFALDEYNNYFLPYIEYLDLLGFERLERPIITGGFVGETYKYKMDNGQKLTVSWTSAVKLNTKGNNMTVSFDP